jgi:uncharacterized protein (DUF1499 family)
MKALVYIFLALPLLLLAAGQLGLLKGQLPNDLGVRDGRLKGLSNTPNCVSSQAGLQGDHVQRTYAQIDPLPLKGDDAAASMAALVAVLEQIPGMTLAEQRADYVYAQSQTRWLQFVDDVEFWANPATGVIEVRSASRLGSADFGTNRQRIEAIRAAYLSR